jgi:hypothetical protein
MYESRGCDKFQLKWDNFDVIVYASKLNVIMHGKFLL